MTAPAAPVPAALPWTRVLYWSVRRELWEHRVVLLPPAAVAAIGLIGFLFSALGLPGALAAVEAGSRERSGVLLGPYPFVALVVLATGLWAALFYSLTALQGERRDRSLLFWKSLPVSDLTTVLAKAAVPAVVIPAVTLVVIVAAQILMLAWSAIVTLVTGHQLATLLGEVKLGTMWVVLPYGLLVNVFWMAPVWSWCLLVSAWSRRVPILWALAPFVAPAILERMALGTTHIFQFLGERVLGGYAMAFSVGGKAEEAVDRIDQLRPLHILAQPGLWIGLVFAAAFLAAATWLRRRRAPA